jgi:sec-independent protein translocase protein TatC
MTVTDEELDRDIGEEGEEKRLSFIEHLEELRSRIIYCLTSILVTTIAAFFFSETLLNILYLPAKKTLPNLNYTSLLDPFNIRLKVSFGAGIIISSPFILYELWKFISPALKQKEKKIIRLLFSAALGFFVAGVLMAYFWILPFGIPFLLAYATPIMKPLITINEYYSLVSILMVAMGVVFESPLVIIGLYKIGIITAKQLSRNRRFAFLAAVFLACAITPGNEFWTSTFLIIPLYLLYELSIWVIIFIEKR